DFLGVRNLDVITDTVAMVRATRNPAFDIDAVPLDDPKVFALLARGDTMGVFQLESPPMRALLRSMRPTTFEHVSAVLALYRPGPMGVNMHNDYADRVNDRQQVTYFHPDAEAVLGDTYGLMIYQESVMRVAQKFAGYTLAEADNLRKACGKKVRELMAKERATFEDGCERTGYGRNMGRQLFDVIEKFADYAFNKSHTFGYGLVTYQTAYLKAHYPVEYMAALLTSVKDKLDKAAVYLADCRSAGIPVLTPDINRAETDFTALSADRVPPGVELPRGCPGAIVFGLSAVRNVGVGLMEQLLEERRENGPYESFQEFAERAPEPVLHRRTVESLIRAGAFDGLGHPRLGLLAVFEQIIDTTLTRRRERSQGVMSLFGDWAGEDADPVFEEAIEIPDREFDKSERLRVEKEMLGLYVSDHPLRGAESALRRRVERSITDLETMDDGSIVVVGGVVTTLARKYTRAGDQMATFVLEDLAASIEVTVFPKMLATQGHKLQDDVIVAVKARLDRRDESRFGLIAMEISVLDGLSDGPASLLTVRLSANQLDAGGIDRLREIISEHPGRTPVEIEVPPAQVVRLPDDYRVDVDRVIGEIRVAFGHDAVRL
ncbi:MAG: DNA polymerase III subunit alpha, partial [Ilumatobacteraceae bacterium]